MNKSIFFCLFFLFGSMYFPAMAGNSPVEIILTSEEWTNATNRDGTGLYWDIFRSVYEPLGIKTKFIIRPYSGSIGLIKRKKADALVGAYPDVIKEALFPKYPFDKGLIFVLFKKDKLHQWNGHESLKGKKVGWIKGFSFDEFIEVPVIKEELSSREEILRRLDEDRIDFFMDSRNDLESVLNIRIVDVTRYTVEPVMELDRYLAFANNRKGEKLKDIFDERFPKLVQSGEIEKLFAKWNW